MKPAIFLDRDGVIIHNVDSYVRTMDEVIFYESSIEALKLLRQTSYKIVIITNQSVVGRGIISVDQAHAINQEILTFIENSGGHVDGCFICPHAPEEHCSCRKPAPGLILEASKELSIDLAHSIMVGDALTDIQAGQAANIPTNILVQTGRGTEQLSLKASSKLLPFLVCSDLKSAVMQILADQLKY